MAIELCSESPGMSPRISFSHDLSQTDVVPIEQRPLRSKSSGLNSSIDFDFCVRESFDHDSSSADELFSDGKLLPTEIKKRTFPSKQTDQSDQSLPPQPKCPPSVRHSNKESSKEIKITGDDPDEKQNSKSFWRFRRSTSLNCGSGYARSLCPLPLLSRSNSTGSTPNVKKPSFSKDHSHIHKKSSQSSSSSSSMSYYQKPPLKKNTNYAPQGINGIRVSPVLNVSSGNLFGLGSIFFNGKEKNKKK